jgi:uncharacterized RDD family membrane protein YckC
MVYNSKVMKCPNCGFHTFDHIDKCKRCGNPLEPKLFYRGTYNITIEDGGEEERKELLGSNDEGSFDLFSGGVGFDASASETKSMHVADEIENDDLVELEEKELFLLDLAEPFTRAIAFFIDIVIVSLVAAITLGIGLYIAGLDPFSVTGFLNMIGSVYFLMFIFASTYFVFLHGYGGKTIGKMIMGIRTIKDNGEPTDINSSFIRWVGYFISTVFLFAGFLWAIFDPMYQTWHDKLAGTCVVKE